MANRLSLGNHWEQFIQQEINSGRYISASEVLRDALRALEERKRDHQASMNSLLTNSESVKSNELFNIDHIINE